MTDQPATSPLPVTDGGVRARAARWGLIVVALLLGVGLIGSSLWSYRQARALVETLAVGQAEAFLRALRERTRPESGPPTEDVLAQVLGDHTNAGLRYLALLDREGRVLRAVGEPAVPALPTPPPGDLSYREDRVRMTAPPAPPPPPPPPWSWHGGDGAPSDRAAPVPPLPPPAAHPPPPRLHSPPPHHDPLVMEFEPLAARELIGRARVGVVVGMVGALVLMLAAAVFWRLSLRADRTERRLARQRHLAALGEMSAVMAHEIRNPLAAAKGHAQLLTEQLPGGDPAGDRARTVVEQLARLEQLTGELLDFSRSGTISRQQVDPAELLGQAVASVDGERVTVADQQAPPQWSLDPRRMGQVLTNLLRNALDAEPDRDSEDDVVEATVRLDDGHLVFEIRDRGPGLSPDQGARIFEPFHTTRLRGTGLGLAITRQIVHLHGGTVEGTNHPDGGALFRVIIPPSTDSTNGAREQTA